MKILKRIHSYVQEADGVSYSLSSTGGSIIWGQAKPTPANKLGFLSYSIFTDYLGIPHYEPEHTLASEEARTPAELASTSSPVLAWLTIRAWYKLCRIIQARGSFSWCCTAAVIRSIRLIKGSRP